MQTTGSAKFRGVLFDLLTALLDSRSLWTDVAGSAAAADRWREEYLRITYGTGRYRAYEDLVAEAAIAVGLGKHAADELADRYHELRPWPEAKAALEALAALGLKSAVVTNCSERLGRLAAGCVGVRFDTVVTAERAGWYKPHAQPYLLGLDELGMRVDECLFVAGSAYDLIGTARVRVATFWHNRSGLPLPPHIPPPAATAADLRGLSAYVTAIPPK